MRIQRDAQTIRTHLQGDINPFYTLTPGIQEVMLEPKTKGSDMQFWEKCTWCKKKKKKYTVQIHCDGEEKRKKDTSKKHWKCFKGFKSTRYDSNATSSGFKRQTLSRSCSRMKAFKSRWQHFVCTRVTFRLDLDNPTSPSMHSRVKYFVTL